MVIEPEQEARLIERARSDPEAFADLYDEYLPAVYGFVMRRVRHRETAEDLTSQVFEKVLKSLGGLREGAAFKGWLFRIADNTVIEHFRSTGRRQTYSMEEAGEMANGKSRKAVDDLENRMAVTSLLDRLPEKYSSVLVMHYLDGLTIDEMAAALNTTTNACYVRIYRATKEFAGLLERHGIKGIDDYVRT